MISTMGYLLSEATVVLSLCKIAFVSLVVLVMKPLIGNNRTTITQLQSIFD